MTDRIQVWLIEDHKTYGERLARALNRLDGIACPRRFTACEDALAALPGNDAPHVLLLDVELPGMNGIEGIARLRQLAPHASVVILTVFEDDDKIFRAICAGAAGYLLKTSSTEDIAAAIRRLLDMRNISVDRPTAEAGLAVLEAGGDFADGVIAHDGQWLGGETFVSFDVQAVRLLDRSGVKARLLSAT